MRFYKTTLTMQTIHTYFLDKPNYQYALCTELESSFEVNALNCLQAVVQEIKQINSSRNIIGDIIGRLHIHKNTKCLQYLFENTLK